MRDIVIQLRGKCASIVHDPEPNLVGFQTEVIGVAKVDPAK